METTDLVERVARAIASKLGNGSPLAARLEAARAALEAAGVPALQARVEKLEGALRGIAFAVRHGTETDVQAWANLANACQQTASTALAEEIDDASTALAEDYCGIVEVNEEDFKAEGPLLTPGEEAELVERINANPNLRPLAEGEGDERPLRSE